VLRARAGGNKGDTTVKYRPWHGPVPEGLYAYEGFKCETDATAEGAVFSCSLTAPRDPQAIAAVASGERKPRHLFTDAQRSWTGDNMWEGVRPLGPIRSESWKTQHPRLGELAFERWQLPGGPSYCELSFRAGADGPAGFAALRKELAQLGIRQAAQQGAKTRAAMQFFARQQ
jgi:hypothetical protein